METYKKWVRSNRDFVHSLESLANGLTWLLPERFSESEIGPEAVTTVLGIITAVNEHIIDTSPAQRHASPHEFHSFPFPLCISALKDLENLVEVAAQHWYGDEKKWNFIAIMEAMKAVVRIALFQNSGYKMILQGGETPNVENPEDASTSDRKVDGFPNFGLPNGHANLRNSYRQGAALTALSSFGENARMASEPPWLRRVQHQHAIMEPPKSVMKPTLTTILSQRGIYGALVMTAELLFILRPLVYVLFIRKYGIRSWIPWLISLGIDFTGMGILSQATVSVCENNARRYCLSTSEKDEIKRRKLLWAFYLFRDPFFTKYTRQRLERTDKVLEPVPVIGFLTGKIVELIIGAQTRYTYTSGS